jgi:hypothetical protein
MPFDDNTILSYREETPLDRRRQLIAALRAPMPEKFEWDFSASFRTAECGSAGCALGLAHILWPDKISALPGYSDVGGQIGLSAGATREIMGAIPHLCRFGYLSMSSVTPAMVADALEETLDAI